MVTEKSTALALPTSLEEIRGMADAFVKSGMFSDTKQLSQAIVKIQAGRELGLPPVYSMQNINLIRDRLTTSANTMAMLVKRSGSYNYRIKEHTDQVCIIAFYEKDGGKWLEVGVSSFSMEDAKRANLVKPDSGWVKFPRAMLFSRAISQGARIYAPDAIGGVYTDEEIRSIPARLEDEKTQPEPSLKTAEDAPHSNSGRFLAQANGNPSPEAEQLSDSPIDLDWVRETMGIIKWTEVTAKSWLRGNLKVQTGDDTLEKILLGLPADKLQAFQKKLQDLRSVSGK